MNGRDGWHLDAPVTQDADPLSFREFVTERLRRGIPDARFDVVFPLEWRRRSQRYWTPVDVALRAAAWFVESGASRVLDIGSGVGKMCLVGGLATDLEFVGVEHRRPLVDAACAAADILGLSSRVTFEHATIEAFDASPFHAFYLYNPFGENLYGPPECLDSTVELSAERHWSDTRIVENILNAAPVGTRVVTYHGFGGRIPNCYAPERFAQIGSDALRLWVKRRMALTGHYVELGGARLENRPGNDADDDGASGR